MIFRGVIVSVIILFTGTQSFAVGKKAHWVCTWLLSGFTLVAPLAATSSGIDVSSKNGDNENYGLEVATNGKLVEVSRAQIKRHPDRVLEVLRKLSIEIEKPEEKNNYYMSSESKDIREYRPIRSIFSELLLEHLKALDDVDLKILKESFAKDFIQYQFKSPTDLLSLIKKYEPLEDAIQKLDEMGEVYFESGDIVSAYSFWKEYENKTGIKLGKKMEYASHLFQAEIERVKSIEDFYVSNALFSVAKSGRTVIGMPYRFFNRIYILSSNEKSGLWISSYDINGNCLSETQIGYNEWQYPESVIFQYKMKITKEGKLLVMTDVHRVELDLLCNVERLEAFHKSEENKEWLKNLKELFVPNVAEAFVRLSKRNERAFLSQLHFLVDYLEAHDVAQIVGSILDQIDDESIENNVMYYIVSYYLYLSDVETKKFVDAAFESTSIKLHCQLFERMFWRSMEVNDKYEKFISIFKNLLNSKYRKSIVYQVSQINFKDYAALYFSNHSEFKQIFITLLHDEDFETQFEVIFSFTYVMSKAQGRHLVDDIVAEWYSGFQELRGRDGYEAMMLSLFLSQPEYALRVLSFLDEDSFMQEFTRFLKRIDQGEFEVSHDYIYSQIFYILEGLSSERFSYERFFKSKDPLITKISLKYFNPEILNKISPEVLLDALDRVSIEEIAFSGIRYRYKAEVKLLPKDEVKLNNLADILIGINLAKDNNRFVIGEAVKNRALKHTARILRFIESEKKAKN